MHWAAPSHREKLLLHVCSKPLCIHTCWLLYSIDVCLCSQMQLWHISKYKGSLSYEIFTEVVQKLDSGCACRQYCVMASLVFRHQYSVLLSQVHALYFRKQGCFKMGLAFLPSVDTDEANLLVNFCTSIFISCITVSAARYLQNLQRR